MRTHRNLHLLAALAGAGCLGLAATAVRANVYPSSLSTVTDVTDPTGCATPVAKITYILNENANGTGALPGVKIEVVNSGNTVVRTVTIARQKKGKQTFLWDGRDNAGARVPNGTYKIKITAADFGHSSWAQISDETTNNQVRFYRGIGVAVNTNPDSIYYGRIYVNNATAGTTVTYGRACGDGIYVLNADQSDAVGQGDTARTGSIDWVTGGTSSPFRCYVGKDDHLYISDWSDGHGGVYRTDADVSDGSGEQVLSGIGDTVNPTVHGSTVGTPVVTGTLAGGDLTLYAVDEDLPPVTTYWKWAIGSGPLPYNSPPTQVSGVLIHVISVLADNDLGPDGKHYLSQNRSAGTEAGLFVVSADGSTTLWDSLTATRTLSGNPSDTDILKHTWGIKVSPSGDKIAVATTDGITWAIDLDSNGYPILPSRVSLASGSEFTRDADFDTAGNIYTVTAPGTLAGGNANNQQLRIFSPPTGPHSNSTSSQGYSLSRTGSGGPTINSHPTDQTVCPGDNATFTVLASGAGLTYQWRKDGVDLSGQTSSSLTLTGVVASDDDSVIEVVVCDANGVAVSKPVLLNVGPYFVQQPVTTTGCVSGSAEFSATVHGLGTVHYQWQKDGSPLSDNADVVGAMTNHLTLSNLAAGDDGALITVVVTDDCGAGAAITSGPATLHVSTGPTVAAFNTVTVSAGTADQRFDANVTKVVGSVTYQWKYCTGSGCTPTTDVPADNMMLPCGAIVTGGTTTSLHLKNIPFACNQTRLAINATDNCGSNTSTNDCTLTVSAPTTETGLCNNGLDDDGDGFADCADSDCAADPACACNTPWADAEGPTGVGVGKGDGDVDMDDFGVFQRCYDPTGTPPAGTYCHCFDHNNSGHVDQDDFALFMGCAAAGSNGANVPNNCP